MGQNHSASGWWRYSQLNAPTLLGIAALVVALWAITDIEKWPPLELTGALIATLARIGYAVTGGIRAERARRYGCW